MTPPSAGLPPRLAEWLMARSLPDADRIEVVGDLFEEYAARCVQAGVRPARRWYWRQVRRSLLTNVRRRLSFWWERRRLTAPRDAAGSRSTVGGLMQDLRYALRELVRRPATPFIIVTTLALCLGAATTVFSIVNGLLLRPLPVRQPDELVTIESPAAGDGETPWTYAIWEGIARRPQLFAGVMAWSPTELNIALTGEADIVKGLFVSASFFDVLGVAPAEGRFFTAGDDVRGGGAAGSVVVISDAFWRRRFGGDPSLVGRTIDLGARRATVIGVTPASFTGPEVGRPFDVAMPIASASPALLDGRVSWWISIMGRLKPGQSPASTQAALAAAQAGIRDESGPANSSTTDRQSFERQATFQLRSAWNGTSSLRQRYGRALEILLVAMLVVLTIACSNIATLLIARATVRADEMSVRAALGASRWRLLRTLIFESGCMAAAGAALGLALAQLGSRVLIAQFATTGGPIALGVSPDWRVAGFAFALAAATTLLFGLAPAVRAMRADPGDALKAGSRTIIPGGRIASADVFLFTQLSLSLVLVVSAVLLVRTFVGLTTEPLGFDVDRLFAVDLRISGEVPHAEQVNAYEAARARAAAVPGVKAAALSLLTPLSGLMRRLDYAPAGVAGFPDDTRAFVNVVSPEWFQTTGMRILSGRAFAGSDREGSEDVVIVNDEFARVFFGGVDPVGRVVLEDPAGDRRPLRVVGRVANSYYRSLRESVQPIAFLPIAQSDSVPHFVLTVQAAGASVGSVARSATAAVAEDRRLRLTTTTYRQQVDDTLRQERVLAWLSGSLGVIALALAAVGLFGMAKSLVESRRRELGIRLMLGSAPAAAARLVVRRVAWLIAGGLAGGLAASVASTHVLSTLLFGVSARDPWTMAVAAGLLATVGLVAAWRPVVRATQIDPAEVLRRS